MLKLDRRGYLMPKGPISSELDELMRVFATNDVRRELLQRYLNYSARLKDICNCEYIQWVNGSFCTAKDEPNDVDIISFIPASLIDSDKTAFAAFSYPNSEHNFKVDAYIVKIYEEGHRYHSRFIGDRAYWLDKFSRTKRTRAGIQHDKGFVELMF